MNRHSDQSSPVTPYAWRLLFLLVCVYSCCWMDRYLIVILIEPIHRDLGLSDTQMGLITGFAFTAVYSLAGVPIGYLADRGSKRIVLAIAATGWGVVTMLSSLAQGFRTLAFARFGVAAFESGCSPAAYSLISESFPPSHRGRAIAIYGLGPSLGIWAGLMFGGLLNQHFGWRAAFVVLGLPALLLAVVVYLFVREPKTSASMPASGAASPVESPLQALRLVLGRRAFVAASLALGALTITSTSFMSWAPTYLIRFRDLDSAQVGVISGTIVGASGIFGTLCAGLLADRLSRRDPRWYLWLPALGFALFLPFERLFFSAGGNAVFFVYFVAAFASATYSAPLFAVGQFVLPPRQRALGAAVMLMVLNLVGMGGGAFAVGYLSDAFRASDGDASLQNAILSLQAASLVGFACLAYAATAIRREMDGIAVARPAN